jgi:hypothetical protein
VPKCNRRLNACNGKKYRSSSGPVCGKCYDKQRNANAAAETHAAAAFSSPLKPKRASSAPLAALSPVQVRLLQDTVRTHSSYGKQGHTHSVEHRVTSVLLVDALQKATAAVSLQATGKENFGLSQDQAIKMAAKLQRTSPSSVRRA